MRFPLTVLNPLPQELSEWTHVNISSPGQRILALARRLSDLDLDRGCESQWGGLSTDVPISDGINGVAFDGLAIRGE